MDTFLWQKSEVTQAHNILRLDTDDELGFLAVISR
jgi:hypothetical protein